ncbi:MAG: OmpA family protein [bacterium]|nr:OmpA family protein [bacterium]
MLAVVVAPATSHAALANGFSSENFVPAISDDSDLITVYRAGNVEKGGWNAGFYFDFAQNPIEVGAPPGQRQAGITDYIGVGHFYGTYGILDWMSVGVEIPIFFYNRVNPLINYGPTGVAAFSLPLGTFDNQTNLGDIRIEFKFRVRDNSDRLLGIALIPFVRAPSGRSLVFSGNEAVTGGLLLVLDFNIHERVKLALNVGGRINDTVDLNNVEYGHQLLTSLGISIKIIERLFFIAEGQMQPFFREFFQNEVQVPAEALGAFRIKLSDNFNLNVGGGAGLTIGIGSPDWRAFLGLNYNWAPAPCPACAAPPEVEARKITIDSRIHFAFDRAVIRPQSYPILNDVAAIIKANQSQIKTVMIEGNTDSIGSDAYNMKLSERRANSVRNYLIKKGVPANMLDTVGFGETRPIATNTTAEGRAKNRRVEFKVIGN